MTIPDSKEAPCYKKERDEYNLKYKMKVENMISNIKQSSFKHHDKIKLLNGLSNMLHDATKPKQTNV